MSLRASPRTPPPSTISSRAAPTRSRSSSSRGARRADVPGLLPDYSKQAGDYADTRSASPSTLRALRAALEAAPGRRLLVIGGGTGNYALALKRDGWEPVVLDRSREMLARAAAKRLETVVADAQRLPFADDTFDAATMISMLHHVDDQGAAIAEARRVLRPRGVWC